MSAGAETKFSGVTRAATILLQALIVGGLCALWQWAPDTIVDDTLVSRPADILGQLLEWLRDGVIRKEAASTLATVAFGLVGGGLLGLGLGVASGLMRPLERILDGPLNVMFAIPKVALVPLFIVWFGVDLLQHAIYTGLVVFFFFYFAALRGVRDTPRHLVAMLSLVGASPLQKIRVLYLPAAFGWILGALRVAIPYGFVSAVSAEVIASRSGLGHLVKTSAAAYDPAGALAAALALLVLSVACSVLVLGLGERSRWRLHP